MFRITDGKGFHITFPNGVTLSTQFGGGNYCANYDFKIGKEHAQDMISPDAEIAIWDKDHKWITETMERELFPSEYYDSVMGRVNMDMWLKIFDWCRNWVAS